MIVLQVSEYVDNNPRLRRDYRRWLGELFEKDADNESSSDDNDSDDDIGRTRINYGRPRVPTATGSSHPTRGRRKPRRYRRSAPTEARAAAANCLPGRVPPGGRGQPSRALVRDGRPGATRATLRRRTPTSRVVEGSSKARTRGDPFSQPRLIGNGRDFSNPAQAAMVAPVVGDPVPMATPGSWEERLSVYQQPCRTRSDSGRKSPTGTDASRGEPRNEMAPSGVDAKRFMSAAGVGTGVIGMAEVSRAGTDRKEGIEDGSWIRLGQGNEDGERESATPRRKLPRKPEIRGAMDPPGEVCTADIPGAPTGDDLSVAKLPRVGVRNKEVTQDRTQGTWKRTRSSLGKRRRGGVTYR